MEHTTPCDTDFAASPARPRPDRVGARVPQGYNLNIRIRFGARQGALSCVADESHHPRVGSAAATTRLPKALVFKLEESDPKIVNWLAQNASNRQLFIAQPVDALVAAGVELTRYERKVLQRIHRAAGETNVLPPGAELAEVTVTTAKNRGNKTGGD
ncbi:hypothetical protein [Nocardia sp. NPDC058480]|uniref:hypothetical protein n=1 Tax=unclassified Nocardia TaxID=2637762 RepID=UPI003652E2E4